MDLLTREEVEDRLAEIAPEGAEYEALCFLQHAYYLQAEGVIDIEHGRLYALDAE